MPIHVIDIGPAGPLIGIGLGVGRNQAAAGRGGPPGTYNGLIDTGASTTAISHRVRESLQLRQLSRIPVWRPGGIRATASSFDIRLKFEGHLSPFPWFDLEVVEADPATPGVDLLIGQDLLLRVSMVYNGPLAKIIIMY